MKVGRTFSGTGLTFLSQLSSSLGTQGDPFPLTVAKTQISEKSPLALLPPPTPPAPPAKKKKKEKKQHKVGAYVGQESKKQVLL